MPHVAEQKNHCRGKGDYASQAAFNPTSLSGNLLPKAKPDDAGASDRAWVIRPFGEGIHAAATITHPHKKPQTVCIVDIGSNSLKSVVFDLSENPPTVVDKYDKILGLANGQKPNDPAPKLNAAAVEVMFAKALPRVREQIADSKADTVTVLCTEAVRAVDRVNPREISAFRAQVAMALALPVQAVNVVSESVEAQLAAKAITYGNPHSTGFAVTTGGGSTELARVSQGRVRRGDYTTLRFGARTLAATRDPRAVVEENLGRVLWFRDQQQCPLDAKPAPGRAAAIEPRREDLLLQGGTFRVVGRVLAQRLHNIDFAADTPFGGVTFAWDKQLDGQLQELRRTNFAKLENEFIRREQPKMKNWDDDDLADWKKSKDYHELTESSRYAKWHKRIGRRAEFIVPAVEIILAAEDRVNPRAVTFTAHSTREGALMHAACL